MMIGTEDEGGTIILVLALRVVEVVAQQKPEDQLENAGASHNCQAGRAVLNCCFADSFAVVTIFFYSSSMQ